MRRLVLILPVLLMIWAPSLAQPPAPAGPPPAAALNPNDPLDQLLLQWEQTMKNVTSLLAQCSRTDTDKVIGQVKVWTGSVKYLAPSSIRLELTDNANPSIWELYLLTPNALFEYKSAVKMLFIRQMPPAPPGQAANTNQFALLFGMTARAAKQRYDIRFDPHQDANFYYLAVLPRDQQDKAEFSRARLVLDRKSLMPRQVWFQTPNQNEVLWDLPVVNPQAPMNRNDFTRPATPAGWREQLIPLPNAQPAR